MAGIKKSRPKRNEGKEKEMIINILAIIEPQKMMHLIRLSLTTFTLLLIYGVPLALIIFGLVRLIRFLGRTSKELKLTRIELGKLAEEVHLIRQKLQGGKDKESSAELG